METAKVKADMNIPSGPPDFSRSVIARILAMRHDLVERRNIDSWRFPNSSVFNIYSPELAFIVGDFTLSVRLIWNAQPPSLKMTVHAI